MPRLFCQVWYRDSVSIVRAQQVQYLWYQRNWPDHQPGFIQPYLISCPVKNSTDLITKASPEAVSITNRPCQQARNSLKVSNSDRGPGTGGFSVCSPALDELSEREDSGPALMEWLELMRLLGVKKVSLYRYSLPDSAMKVLEHYANKKDGDFVVESVPVTVPGRNPNSRVAR